MTNKRFTSKGRREQATKEAVRLRREFLKYKQFYEREVENDEGTNKAI